MFSKACEYGIRAMIFIAEKSTQGERCNLQEISSGIGSPVAFTAKILQKLSKNGIIESMKGPHGGFEVTAKKINRTTLAEIVIAIDGSNVINHCVLGLDKCSDAHPCPVHHKYLPIKNELLEFLYNTHLKVVVSDYTLLQTYIRS